jgi:hypothetical protein
MSEYSPVSKVLMAVGVAVGTTVARAAVAEPPPPVDVVLHDAPPPRRIVAIEWNPLALIIGKWVSVDVVIAPINHHSIVLSPFYASTTTAPICVVTDSGSTTSNCGIMGPPSAMLPQQTFEGFGGEIGYRYYWGHAGPRGAFVGPSLVLASMTAKAQDGSHTSFWDYGFAADAGYEALVADRVALTLGGGVQYTLASKSIPNQQLPAAIYANSGVRPRLLASLGVAF